MIQKQIKKLSLRAAAVLLLLLSLLLSPAGALEKTEVCIDGRIIVPGAGSVPRISANGAPAYSMLAGETLPESGLFQPAEYEDAGLQAILAAGFPLDELGLQEKYKVSDDAARVATQQAIWLYMAGWKPESRRANGHSEYLDALLQAAEEPLFQPPIISITPLNPAFQKQEDGLYRSEVLTVEDLTGSISVDIEDGVQLLGEDGAAVTTLQEGDRFVLTAAEELTEIALQVTHRFPQAVPVQYSPLSGGGQSGPILQAQQQEQTRTGTWRFALPLGSASGSTGEPAPPTATREESAPAASESIPYTDSPDTGDSGTPFPTAALLGLCWVATGLVGFWKRTRAANGRKN